MKVFEREGEKGNEQTWNMKEVGKTFYETEKNWVKKMILFREKLDEM